MGINLFELSLDLFGEFKITLLNNGAFFWKCCRLKEWNQLFLPIDATVDWKVDPELKFQHGELRAEFQVEFQTCWPTLIDPPALQSILQLIQLSSDNTYSGTSIWNRLMCSNFITFNFLFMPVKDENHPLFFFHLPSMEKAEDPTCINFLHKLILEPS